MSKKNICLFSVFFILLLSSIIFITGFYIPKKKETEFQDKVNLSIKRMMFKYNEKKGDYLLVKFPDKSEIVSKDGIINTKEKLKEFKKGYIIIYDIDHIAFRLTDGKNCAYKKMDSVGKITMNKTCEDYDIEYKKED